MIKLFCLRGKIMKEQLVTAYQLNEFQLFFSSACFVVKAGWKVLQFERGSSRDNNFSITRLHSANTLQSVRLIMKKINNSSVFPTSPYSRSFILWVLEIKASVRHISGWLCDDELWLSDLNLQNQIFGYAVDNGTKILLKDMFFDIPPYQA